METTRTHRALRPGLRHGYQADFRQNQGKAGRPGNQAGAKTVLTMPDGFSLLTLEWIESLLPAIESLTIHYNDRPNVDVLRKEDLVGLVCLARGMATVAGVAIQLEKNQ